jgi:hypothetical protein
MVAQTGATAQERLAQVTLLDFDLFNSDGGINVGALVIIGLNEFSYYLARTHDRARDFADILVRDFASYHGRSLAPVLVRDLTFARDLTFIARARVYARVSASVLALAQASTSTLAQVSTSASVLALAQASTSASASALALAQASAGASANTFTLARDLASASISVFDLERIKDHSTSRFFDLVLLLVLLSICMSFSALELVMLPEPSPQPFWRSLFARRKKKMEHPLELEIQKTLNKGIVIYHQLERLEKRRQGKEMACEGILIIKERKGE